MRLFYSIFFTLCFLFFPQSLDAGDKSVSINDVTLNEGNSGTTVFTFTVTSEDNTDATDTVDYTIYNETARSEDGDYVAGSGTVNFLGNKTATLNVSVNGDTTPEADETFKVIIHNLSTSNTSYWIKDNTGIGTIVNDDFGEWPPIISYIPQQYAMKSVSYILNLSDYITQTNGDSITYTLTNLDTNASFNNTNGLTFDANTGILSGTPTTVTDSDPLEPYNLRVTATDNDGSVFADFKLNVDYGFCYQYAYKQSDNFFTEENDGTQYPYIRSTQSDNITINNSDLPVKTSIYLKYNSNVEITDFNVSILDINTSQLQYISGTTTLTTGDSIVAVAATVDSETSSSINDIQIGTPLFEDHFFIKYHLNPSVAILDAPINVELSFSANGISYNKTLGTDFPLCSYIADTSYAVVNSIFTVVHNDYYNASTSYYNLPTQVVNREGNFKVIALEPGTDTLQEINATIVAVEMIDVSKYGTIEASCQQPDSAITGKVWVLFSNSSSTAFDSSAITDAINEQRVSELNGVTISTSSEFYNTARQNVSFRTSYNYDANDEDLVQLEVLTPGPKYNVLNFPDIVKIGECAVDMDGNPNSTDMIAQWCSNAGTSINSAMTVPELIDCMECVYGIATKLTCSRDNFSIRPEAFKIKFDDQNQTNSLSQITLTPPINAAAGYNYNIEINATTHISDKASSGYSRASISDIAHYSWNSATATSATGCDDSNISLDHTITNGLVDANTSLNQVGEYRLNLLDSTWTAVDNDPSEMSHHSGSYFLPSTTADCVADSTITQAVNYSPGSATPSNGCNISSSHTNNTLGITYNDYNIAFHPYKFDLADINSSTGLNNDAVTSTSYIYMADMNKTQEMSYHLNGFITPKGYNDSNLSNFVTGCYAKPIDINITRTMDPIQSVAYQYRFNTLNASDVNISTLSGDLNDTAGPIQLSEGNFTQALNGSLNSNLNLNFFRENNNSINPRKVEFHTYSVDCTNADLNCTFSADLTTKTTQGELSLDHNITHLYGRTHAQRHRFQGSSGTAFIYYEVFCNGTDSENITCSKSMLPNGTASTSTDDPRWFKNTTHDVSDSGNIGTVIQKGGAGLVTAGAITNNIGLTTVPLTYDGSKGYPYKTTMENNASNWLIYNKYNVNATKNEFEVEFESEGDWSGEHETNTTTKSPGTIRTNRRIMW